MTGDVFKSFKLCRRKESRREWFADEDAGNVPKRMVRCKGVRKGKTGRK